MSVTRFATVLLAGSLLVAGCGPSSSNDSTEPSDPPASTEPSGQQFGVELVADLDPSEAGVVAEAVNGFGFDLLGGVTTGDENAVTSPISVATLLAMVLAGAGGDTAEAMADVLHLDDSRDVRVGALLRQLADTDDVTLSVANALFAQDGYPFEDDYMAFVRDSFGATVDETDLGAQETADEIDAWVAEHTEGRIEEIAEDLELPNAQAVLVLLNAVYFLGTWTTEFDPADTRDEPFTLVDGSQVAVPLMSLNEQEFAMTSRDGYQMLRLPYGEDGRYGMEVLLPDVDSSLPELLASLDADEWRAAVDNLSEQHLGTVALPRFELEWSAKLNDPLRQLGMGIAFGGGDFRPMSPGNPFLDTVAHKTYIRVDESGTEAAAVTGGVMATSAGLGFRVDRPFAFTISDRDTGTILFLGAVADPRS